MPQRAKECCELKKSYVSPNLTPQLSEVERSPLGLIHPHKYKRLNKDKYIFSLLYPVGVIGRGLVGKVAN